MMHTGHPGGVAGRRQHVAPRQTGLTYRSIATVLRPPVTVITRRHWAGAEHLPPAGVGCIVAANHLSAFDPLVVAHFLHDNGRAPRFMAKASLFDLPVAGALLRQVGQIPVYRESRDASLSVRGAVEAIRAGECIVIYPEATLTRDPDLWPMRGKSGAARIALETGCPVVPLAHWGAQRIIGPYSRSVRPLPAARIVVRAGQPVMLSDLAPATSARALRTGTDRIMAAIVGLLEDVRGEVAPVVRFDPEAAGVPSTGNPRRPRRG
jgi:1-acyl-sn-glycerol-3-phosphate acyltransferase